MRCGSSFFSWGKMLFEAEGLAPEIPPIPELCNTVEGGRYRDLLARQGQARHDKGMLLAALSVIGRSLEPVARAVPDMEGDMLVGVEQFLTPLGPTIDEIISPYFEDTGYNHFKALREQLDRNLRQTHRTNPVFPADYRGDDAVETYLKGTMLTELFKMKTPFAIPDALRFEHMHIVAGVGSRQNANPAISHRARSGRCGRRSEIRRCHRQPGRLDPKPARREAPAAARDRSDRPGGHRLSGLLKPLLRRTRASGRL